MNCVKNSQLSKIQVLFSKYFPLTASLLKYIVLFFYVQTLIYRIKSNGSRQCDGCSQNALTVSSILTWLIKTV